MKYSIRAGLALGLAASLLIGLTGCGAAAQPADDWHLGPPESAGSVGFATAPESGDSTATAFTDPTIGTEDSTTVGETTTGTTKKTTRPKVEAPADDPQRPKEEDKGGETGPAVTLPPVTTSTTTTTTTTMTATTTAPVVTGPASTATTKLTTSGTSVTTAAQTTRPATPPIKLPSNGIDVSTFQYTIDWPQVKAAGVDFAMIRVGARGYGTYGKPFKDAKFETNIKGATAAKVDRGVYFFSQAITEEEAREEAQFVLDTIKGYELTYPIAFDFENPPAADARTQVLNSPNKKAFNTKLVLAFCDTIKAAGYYPIVYTGLWWLNNRLDANQLKGKYDIWLAQYTSAAEPGYSPITMWQYSDSGRVPGISVNVDMNKGYVDYAKIIRDGGWNHLK